MHKRIAGSLLTIIEDGPVCASLSSPADFAAIINSF
jgi:hypothetical protein